MKRIQVSKAFAVAWDTGCGNVLVDMTLTCPGIETASERSKLLSIIEQAVPQALNGRFLTEPLDEGTVRDGELPDLQVTEADVARMLRGSMQIMLVARHLARMLVGENPDDQRALIKQIDEQLVEKQRGDDDARPV